VKCTNYEAVRYKCIFLLLSFNFLRRVVVDICLLDCDPVRLCRSLLHSEEPEGTYMWYVVLGGVMVIVHAIGPRVRGFKLDRERCIFKGAKNPEGDFLLRGSEARFLVLSYYGMLNIPWCVIETLVGRTQLPFIAQFLPASLLGVSTATRADRIMVDESGVIIDQMGPQ
jgi:hypothetical protein